ncbi:CapA family protein [Tahibacter amnicola]|uniref:CapA family protein n=1 Tax=Tahibacter amnicola TaxID=2976241 RepID=A0ABY6B8U8_9GAMM|nr:CapA family protein [Tahibacter amnicola]UXI66503.1 CapA family protein [Tahibacter amnicola]
MSCRRAVLILALALANTAPAFANELRLLFTGDILLSRQVHEEWRRRGTSPWESLAPLFQAADWVGGNLEGAFGNSEGCAGAAGPCFAIDTATVPLVVQAGFDVLTHENNHSGDLGTAGRRETIAALHPAGVLALDFAQSPRFFQRGETTLALIAVNTVRGRDGRTQAIPSVELAQKLRLARSVASVVAVSIHWGPELVDWPSSTQRAQAAWLVDQGADVIFGHHPHVVQPAECVSGKPVFYSLGNHLFDQKYPQTKLGAIADCRVRDHTLRCAALATRTSPGSTYPRLADITPANTLADCAAPLRAGLVVDGVAIRPEPWSSELPPDGMALEGWRDGKRLWRSRRQHVLSLEQARLSGDNAPPLLFALERHASPLDMTTGVRPYVYAVGPRGLIARWRGSALAWPLLDAVTQAGDDRSILCALHRGDSFIAPDPTTRQTRVAAYRWNGFGFAGLDPAGTDACARRFATVPTGDAAKASP